MIYVIIQIIIIFTILNDFLSTFYYLKFSVLLLLGIFYFLNVGIIKKISVSSPDKRLVTLNEHNCLITLICLKHFSKSRKDHNIFLLNVYFVKIKNEHGNVDFNYFLFKIFHADNVMPTFYILAVTIKDNIILLHDEHQNIINMRID